ncbi:MAG: citrate synthase [Rhizobium sp.]|uniref:citrate synthase (unknown stereospecificity) n=2 Tax=Sphingobium yanoikuyae TaxID=13690 RepID=A0A430BKT4_SPHYA|nr:MAG: citrate synthase [Rhizobium sp.]RSU52250.1 citrate synthase [Sphingobium yanoikuyae]
MTQWIDRATSLARLRIKPQTLYAYVSRGRIRMEPDPHDNRRSLYNAEDIAALTAKRKRGRKPAAIAESSMAWGEPSIMTTLSTVNRGCLYYRGQDAIAFARRASLEDCAKLLWGSAEDVSLSAPAGAPSDDAFNALASHIAHAAPTLGRGREALASDAAAIVGTLAAVCGATPGNGPLHDRLAEGWGGDKRSAGKIRQALVAIADHDFNASTFAARVTASTGASLAASVLAGLCALSGPRHGGAAAALFDLIDDARRTDPVTAIDRWLARGIEPPGFGHPLYPSGDPRGELMLEGIEVAGFLDRFRVAMTERTGRLPNCDFGLAAMTVSLGLPPDAPFRLFLVGRSVGWCAHAMEQCEQGILIRPRGRYVGALP